MTELEDRLKGLATPTMADEVVPSIERTEVEGAARRRRHRTAQALAAAAVVVLVAGLAVVIVRRPQPTTVDASGSPSTTQPISLVCGAHGGGEPIPTFGTATEVCAQVGGHILSIGFTVDPDVPASDVVDAMAIIRQRLEALGDTGAKVSLVDGVLLVDFDPALQTAESQSVGLLFQDLPGNLGSLVSVSSSDTQP